MTATIINLDVVRKSADEAYDGATILEAHESWTRVVRAFETPMSE